MRAQKYQNLWLMKDFSSLNRGPIIDVLAQYSHLQACDVFLQLYLATQTNLITVRFLQSKDEDFQCSNIYRTGNNRLF